MIDDEILMHLLNLDKNKLDEIKYGGILPDMHEILYLMKKRFTSDGHVLSIVIHLDTVSVKVNRYGDAIFSTKPMTVMSEFIAIVDAYKNVYKINKG